MPASRVLVLEQAIACWSLLDNQSVIRPPAKLVQLYPSFFDTVVQAPLPLHGNHQLDNLDPALGLAEALLLDSEAFVPALHLESRITPWMLVNGIEKIKWRGRLSFHNISIPIKALSSSTTIRTSNLLLLADGAHSPAPAETPESYISSLLQNTLVTSSAS